MSNSDKAQAAKAYLYSAGYWLEQAKAVYPQVMPLDPSNAEDLAVNIVTVQKNVEFLKRLGYTATLDGVTGAAADLAKKISDWTPSKGTLAVGGVALVVIALLVVVIVLK